MKLIIAFIGTPCLWAGWFYEIVRTAFGVGRGEAQQLIGELAEEDSDES